MQHSKICILYEYNGNICLQVGYLCRATGCNNYIKIACCQFLSHDFPVSSGNKKAMIVHETLFQQKLRTLIDDFSQ